MKKAGMQYNGKLRSRFFNKTGKNDLIYYSITKEEYFKNNKL